MKPFVQFVFIRSHSWYLLLSDLAQSRKERQELLRTINEFPVLVEIKPMI
jgi:hypothetical protein